MKIIRIIGYAAAFIAIGVSAAILLVAVTYYTALFTVIMTFNDSLQSDSTTATLQVEPASGNQETFNPQLAKYVAELQGSN